MRLTYRLQVTPPIELAVTPTPEEANGVRVEWSVDADRLTGVSFTVSSVTLEESTRGEILLYNPGVVAKVFAAARFIADRVRLQTGYDALDPFTVVGNSPQGYGGESRAEVTYLAQHITQHQHTSHAHAVIRRPFNPNEVTDFGRLAVPAGHVARGLRTSDPLERYESFFKALEYFAAKRTGDDASGKEFDRQLSAVTQHVDTAFDEAKIEAYRVLRKRIVHTRTTHHLGHLGPNDIEGILRVRAELPAMEQLVLALLKNPPAFPR